MGARHRPGDLEAALPPESTRRGAATGYEDLPMTITVSSGVTGSGV
jgi:hypothetical protein